MASQPGREANGQPSLIRRPLTSLLCVATLLQCAFNAASGAEEQKIHFRAQGLPAITASGPIADATRMVLKEFLDRNPDIEIEPFAMPSIAGSAMDSGPLMAIAAGVPPHAIYVNFRQSSTYIEQGFLEPLEILLARLLSKNGRVRQTDSHQKWLEDPSADEIMHALQSIRQRVPDLVWPVVYRQDESGDTGETHVWTLPTGNVISALFYRKDLFFQAGLDPNRPPQTWDELRDYAQRLTQPERRQYGISFAAGASVSWSMYSFLVCNGARAVVQDPDSGEWRAVYDSREAAEALRYFWDLAAGSFTRDGKTIRGAAYLGGSEIPLLWNRGQIGMQMGYLSADLITNVNPQLVGIAPMPLSHRGTRGSELNSPMMGVFRECTPEQKLAIMKYLWFLTGDEAKGIQTRVMVEGGMGAFVSPELLRRFGYEHLLRRVPREWVDAFDIAMQNGVPEPYGRNTQGIYRWMSEPINTALELQLDQMGMEESIDLLQQILRKSVETVNVKVLGNISSERMATRRLLGSLVLGFIILAFAFGMVAVWRHFSRMAVQAGLTHNWRRLSWGYLLLSPSMLLLLFWDYLPLLGGLTISLLDFRVVGDSTVVWVDNFANVIFDGQFWMAFLRTIYFVVLTIGLGFWPPILLAILLQEIPTATAKYAFRTIYYLPAVVSGVIVMFLWKQLYDPSEYGILNQILLSLNQIPPVAATLLKLVLFGFWLSLIVFLIQAAVKLDELARWVRLILVGLALTMLAFTLWPVIQAFFGVPSQGGSRGPGGWDEGVALAGSLVGRFNMEPLRWLQSPGLAMLCIVIPSVWAGSGPGCILYLAALKTVPEELYEAADIDGATNTHKVVYITLPRMKFLILIQFIAAVIGAFKGGTESIMIMTGGGPNHATTIVSLEIFFRTFLDLRFGHGAAMAWIIGAVLIGFTAYQLKMLSRAEFKGGGQ